MSEFVTVTVRQGSLRGRRRQTPAGTGFLSFQGVPYAKPPLGALRFKAPEPPEPWTGIRDATKFGNMCIHMPLLSKQIVGDEDCLFLNVYTRGLSTSDKKPKAVLFWIHGGGFHEGSGDEYGPEYFMEHDVVFVTFNYRLGALGFLALGIPEAPGNAGLKDQTMALRWVKQNIANFGGDPDNVTILGESAGGVAVHMHAISPLSRGLFRRAICISGSALSWWALAKDPVGCAKRVAVAAGCDTIALDNPTALVKWFKEADPRTLVKFLYAAKTAEDHRLCVRYTYIPSVEPAHQGAFLPDEPSELMADMLTDGEFRRMPIIFGLASHEGIFALPSFRTPEAFAEMDENFVNYMPIRHWKNSHDEERNRRVAQRIKDFYFNGSVTPDAIKEFVDFNTDVKFAHPVITAAREHARVGAPVFLFEFAYVGRQNCKGPLLGSHRLPGGGACHSDPLGYMFPLKGLPPVEDDSTEALVRRRMVRMFADFAQAGNPTPILGHEINDKWQQFSEAKPNYLRISDDLTTSTNIFNGRIDVLFNFLSEEGLRITSPGSQQISNTARLSKL